MVLGVMKSGNSIWKLKAVSLILTYKELSNSQESSVTPALNSKRRNVSTLLREPHSEKEEVLVKIEYKGLDEQVFSTDEFPRELSVLKRGHSARKTSQGWGLRRRVQQFFCMKPSIHP